MQWYSRNISLHRCSSCTFNWSLLPSYHFNKKYIYIYFCESYECVDRNWMNITSFPCHWQKNNCRERPVGRCPCGFGSPSIAALQLQSSGTTKASGASHIHIGGIKLCGANDLLPGSIIGWDGWDVKMYQDDVCDVCLSIIFIHSIIIFIRFKIWFRFRYCFTMFYLITQGWTDQAEPTLPQHKWSWIEHDDSFLVSSSVIRTTTRPEDLLATVFQCIWG